MPKTKVKGILTRQDPPGLILQIKNPEEQELVLKEIDLPDLHPFTDLDFLAQSTIDDEYKNYDL